MATTEKRKKLVEVTITITDADGTTTTEKKTIPEGPTPVPALKQELGVDAADSLFIVKNEKRKLLADHSKHKVNAHDHYEVISKGGVS